MKLFLSCICRMHALLCFLFLFSCSWQPNSLEYRQYYDYANHFARPRTSMKESDYFLIVLVDARHLDYTNNRSFFKTIAKHPSDGSKNGDVGHAWIYLQGKDSAGRKRVIEGGHSGERGMIQAKYFDGIMNYIDFGYANPTPWQKQGYRYEPNPIKYLWETQHDGFFEKGCGRHHPTFAAKVDLTREQFEEILSFINPLYYPYKFYSLTDWQCTSFVCAVASLAGWDLDSLATLPIESRCTVEGECLRFWDDPCYSSITFSSPDILERSLMRSVASGRAEYALNWYLKKTKRFGIHRLHRSLFDLFSLPFKSNQFFRFILI